MTCTLLTTLLLWITRPRERPSLLAAKCMPLSYGECHAPNSHLLVLVVRRLFVVGVLGTRNRLALGQSGLRGCGRLRRAFGRLVSHVLSSHCLVKRPFASRVLLANQAFCPGSAYLCC